MGTRCLTIVQDRGQEVMVMYRQMDGYPEGHGAELKAFLADKVMVNGIGRDSKDVFNGMGCLACQIVAHFKTAPGDFYLHPSGTRDVGEEYIYYVKAKLGERAKVTVEEV